MEPSDKLGEKLWELRVLGDEEPVIFVTNDPDINMLGRLKGDRVFQALILPQAFELVLLHLVDNSGDDDGWQAKWKTYLSARDIEIPERFNTVVLKLCPEIREVVTIGYKSTSVYNPTNFEPIWKFLVAINLFFNEDDIPKGGKEHYEGLFNVI